MKVGAGAQEGTGTVGGEGVEVVERRGPLAAGGEPGGHLGVALIGRGFLRGYKRGGCARGAVGGEQLDGGEVAISQAASHSAVAPSFLA